MFAVIRTTIKVKLQLKLNGCFQIYKGQILYMEAEGDIQAVVLLEIQHVYMHRLVKKEKTLFTSGTCKIAKLENNRNGPVHFINLNSFYYGIQPNIHFIKAVYSDTISYVFPHFENGLSAISIPLIPELSELLDSILKQTARLLTPREAMEIPELRALIQAHYPQLEKQQIYYPDNVKKIIANAGSLLNKAFSSFGGLLKTGVEKAGTFIEGKVSQGQPTQISEQTKQKWHKVKENTTNIINVSSQYAGKIFKPILTKTKEYSRQIEDKINHSDNTTIKYFKELAEVSGKAIGNAFDGIVKGGAEVTKELSNQGKKIITKKYGDGVIKTFSCENNEGELKEKEAKEKTQEETPAKETPAKEEEKKGENSNEEINQSAQNLYPKLE